MVLPIPEQPVPGFQARYPILAALDLLGRRWMLRILWELCHGPLGFRVMQAMCDDLSPSTLSQRLSLLQTTRLITHTEEGSYALTGTGQQLLCALAPLQEWAELWAAQLRTQEETEQSQVKSERNDIPMPSSFSEQESWDLHSTPCRSRCVRSSTVQEIQSTASSSPCPCSRCCPFSAFS